MAKLFSNSGDPDQTPHSAATDLGLHCLPDTLLWISRLQWVNNSFLIWFQERFPPNIYYKIFTHRPIQDMCSNSPKDYTKAEVKLQMTRDKHNTTKTRPLPGEDGKLQ